MVVLKGHGLGEKIVTEEKHTSSFRGFSNLPYELRITIFEFVLVSDLAPKIHCVDERTSKGDKKEATFISNQPISPLLQVCHETRTIYLSKTKAQFAFETYIRFSVDTIYIPDFASREEQFPRFLNHPSSKKIQKLAMR
ncbi:hypothetical protein K3495_g10913 [Podosphaera aphanis]|nr:hypothetical protein K3495_g10913 [Podosphaera aphanis]